MLELKFRETLCVPLSKWYPEFKALFDPVPPHHWSLVSHFLPHTMLALTRQLTVHWTHHAVLCSRLAELFAHQRSPSLLPPATTLPLVKTSSSAFLTPFWGRRPQDTLPQMVLNKHRLSFTLGHLHFLWKVLKSKYFYMISTFEAPFNKPWLTVFHQY